MLKNLALFEYALDKIKAIDFNINMLPIHYDFHKGNILFEQDEISGILDFERLLYAPRILDIAQLIKCTYEPGETRFKHRLNLIIHEYSKINPLTSKEIKLIPLILAKDNCRMFEVFYRVAGPKYLKHNKEGQEGLISCIKWTINVQKNIARMLGWIK